MSEQVNQSEQHSATPEPSAHVEVVIDGQVFKRTVLPPATAETMLNRSGGVRRLPRQSRRLTAEEQEALDSQRREERSIYDRRFSDSGRMADGAPQGDIAWDGSNRVNGAYTPDDLLLNNDERLDQQE